MINLHVMTYMALATFVLIGILIPIHDKIKSFTWIYFEKTNTYNNKAKIVYRVIIALCFVGGTLISLYPLVSKGQIVQSYKLYNSFIVGAINLFVVLLNIVVGGYLGHYISKIFDNK